MVRRSFLSLFAGGILIVGGVALLSTALALGLRDGDDAPPRWIANTAAASLTVPEPAPPTPEPTPALPSPAVELVIPKLGVAAPVTVKSVDAQGVMQDPEGAWDVAWYDFSALPGGGSNVVFSGHRDYVGVGLAVFGRLEELAAGDIVQLKLADGRQMAYQVTESAVYDAATAPVQQIVGPTAGEQLTLITCDGVFDAGSGEYDQRLIVRASPL